MCADSCKLEIWLDCRFSGTEGPAPLACDRRLLYSGATAGKRDLVCGAGGRVEDCDGKEMGVLFIGTGGEVHKHALEIMGNVDWVILQADSLVPSDALLAASSRHGTRLAVVLSNEQHLEDFEPALPRTGALVVSDDTLLNKAMVKRMALNKSESPMLNTVCGGIFLPAAEELKLVTVESVEVVSGEADRVYLDMISMLQFGEGALVGSTAKALCFIHADSGGRAFRINAGPVHAYVALPDGRTKYLSDVEAGDQILMVDLGRGGGGAPASRSVNVGRCQVERRQVARIRLHFDGEHSQLFLEWIDTVRLHGRHVARLTDKRLAALPFAVSASHLSSDVEGIRRSGPSMLPAANHVMRSWSIGQVPVRNTEDLESRSCGQEKSVEIRKEVAAVSNQVELLTVERLRMQMEDLRGQLHRKSQVSEEREEAESVARKALGRAYGKVLEETVLPEILCSKARQSEVAGVAAQHVLGRAYDKVLEGIKALPHEPCERQGTVVLEEKVVLRWVAKDAVARAVTGALCRMLPAGSAGECQAPTRQADANGSQIREPPHADATMLSDSRATGDPGGQEDEMQMTPTSHQEALEACQRESELEKSTCWGSTSPGDHSTDGTGHEVLSAASQEPGILPSVVPPGWDVKSTDNGDGGPNDSEQVELEDDLSELQFRERVDRRTRMWKLRKMRRAWRIWRTAAQHASSRDEDGEEEKESEVVEAEEAQEGLDAGNQPAEGQSPVADSFAEADGLETHEPKEAKRSESEALELDAEAGECKDTLQDKDFARSSSREPAGPIETRAPQTELEPKELRTPRLPSKGDDETRTVEAHLKDLDTDISDVERHDGSAHDGIPRIRKPLAPPLVPCNDIDAWSTRRRAHPHSQQSAFLTSARDSCALPDPQPRRSASAPPERRKRGRRHKIVPRVISTGLATAPTSAVHSPNSVFPTPLLPRERSQASRALAPERGRDRRSKSVTTVTAVSAW
ncbi:aroB' [Symbiodinium microadriaticum]|nr:aroB' [Symbiodinium microadriaticum]